MRGSGGKRPGAGRKRSDEAAELERLTRRLVGPAGEITRDVRDRAATILLQHDKTDEGEVLAWGELLDSDDQNIALRARVELSYLAYPIPKPVDAKVAGTVTIHFHAIDPGWRKGRK